MMRTVSAHAALLLPLLLAAAAYASDPIVLCDDGKDPLPIVISGSAAEATRETAAELSRYLKSISGAEFPIREAAAGPAIFLGTRQEFPHPEFDQPLAIRNTFDGVEAFVIAPRDGSLYLVGSTEKAVPHAAFRLLERLGCRWYFPAREWEIVPRRRRIVVDFEETSRPRILARRIWWGYGFFDRADGHCQADYEAWARRNRMAESFQTYTGHAWQSIILDNKNVFDAHPEYYALVEGQRRGPQMCVSNPAVRSLAVNWALKRLATRPDLDMVSMETSDGSNHCECPDCRELGSISDRAFGLANEVARTVARQHPGKMVGMLAYNDHCEPPSFPLEPNVYVQSTAGFVRGRFTFDELMQLWPQKTTNIGFYEYFSVWLWDYDQLPGGRANDLHEVARRIRQYARLGATSLSCESGNNWGVHGRGYYVANKLMWDPDQDVAALLEDFYRTAFGPAAEPVRRFYERFEAGSRPLMSEHLLALGFRDLDQAARQAADRPDVLARIDHLKQYLHYARVKWELDHLPRTEVERRKQLTLDGLTWCYRTRGSYMNHWAAMWQSWTRSAAAEFDEPGWSFQAKSTPPWQVAEPVTREETERVFQEDLRRFQPQDVQSLEFSADLVWANLPRPEAPSARPRPLLHRYQRPMKYVIASREGEPLRLAITTGVIKHYRDRAAGQWTVWDARGKKLAEGSLPQDGESHPIEVAVPSAGCYQFQFNDQGAGWGIETQDQLPACLALERGQRILHLGQFRDPVFFFVPQGTRTLQFFWEGGNLNPRVHGPNGDLLLEVQQNGRYVSVPVPAGADGKAWFFTRFAPTRIWFTNAPNYLAASPTQLILPGEVLPGEVLPE